MYSLFFYSYLWVKAAGQVRKGYWTSINGVLCKVVDVSTSKTGKHGFAKVFISAVDPMTGRKLEQMTTTTTRLPQVQVSFRKYTLADAEENKLVVVDSDYNSIELEVPSSTCDQVSFFS